MLRPYKLIFQSYNIITLKYDIIGYRATLNIQTRKVQYLDIVLSLYEMDVCFFDQVYNKDQQKILGLLSFIVVFTNAMSMLFPKFLSSKKI